MKNFWRNNGLTVTLFLFFLFFWAGQTISGWKTFNDDQAQHRQPEISLTQYLTTGHFIEATFENWESEFLQMAAYVLLTVFLFQKGSSESKDPDKDEPVDAAPDPNKKDAPGPVKKGGFVLKLYQNSLAIAFFALFLFSFVLHAVGGAREYSREQKFAGEPGVSTSEFLQTPEFWFQSFQNWQSEFLAVIAIVVFSIYLRQHGSPESKPVDAPHSQTGEG